MFSVHLTLSQADVTLFEFPWRKIGLFLLHSIYTSVYWNIGAEGNFQFSFRGGRHPAVGTFAHQTIGAVLNFLQFRLLWQRGWRSLFWLSSTLGIVLGFFEAVQLFLLHFLLFPSIKDTTGVGSVLLTGARRQPSLSSEHQEFILLLLGKSFSGALVQNKINSMTSVA